MDINEKIHGLFRILREHPSMILTHGSDYQYLKNYIEGYIDGLSDFTDKNLKLDITIWVRKNKLNLRESSVYWTDHIPIYYKNKTQEELKAILLDSTEEYFQAHPDWYKTEKFPQ